MTRTTVAGWQSGGPVGGQEDEGRGGGSKGRIHYFLSQPAGRLIREIRGDAHRRQPRGVVACQSAEPRVMGLELASSGKQRKPLDLLEVGGGETPETQRDERKDRRRLMKTQGKKKERRRSRWKETVPGSPGLLQLGPTSSSRHLFSETAAPSEHRQVVRRDSLAPGRVWETVVLPSRYTCRQDCI